VCCSRTIQASTCCAAHLALYQIPLFGRNDNSGVPGGSFSNKLDAFPCNSFLEDPNFKKGVNERCLMIEAREIPENLLFDNKQHYVL